MKRYPAYKDSGVEWIGGIPEHWDVPKLNYSICHRKVMPWLQADDL